MTTKLKTYSVQCERLGVAEIKASSLEEAREKADHIDLYADVDWDIPTVLHVEKEE